MIRLSASSPFLFPEPVHVSNPPLVDSTTTTLMDEVQKVNEEAHDPIDNERVVVSEKEATLDWEPQPNENHITAVTESTSSTAQEDAPKKSYASILSSQTKKGGSGPTRVYVPANTSRSAPQKNEKRSLGLVASDPAPEASAPSASGSAFDSGNAHEEGSTAFITCCSKHRVALCSQKTPMLFIACNLNTVWSSLLKKHVCLKIL